MADVSRDSFDPTKRVSKKIFQQGRIIPDSDLNEQIDINLTQRRRILAMLLAEQSARFGDGFKVVGTGASLQVTIKAGFAAFLIGSQLAELVQLPEDATLSGFTAWASARTDTVYVDIEEVEYDSSDDPDVVNPIVGEETCRDIRLTFSFAISEGAPPGAAPAGHTYIVLGTVTKSSGSTIGPSDVTVLLEQYSVTVDTDDIVDDAVTAAKLNPDVAGIGLTQEGSGAIGVATGGVTGPMVNASAIATGLAKNGSGNIQVADGGIGTTQLADGAVTSPKLGPGAVGETQLADDAVTTNKIAAGAVGTSELANDGVTRDKLNPDVVGIGLSQSVAGALDVNGVKEGGAGTLLKTHVFEIGEWNMDADPLKDVPLPAGVNHTKIRMISVMIRDDLGDFVKQLDQWDNGANVLQGHFFSLVSGGGIALTRLTGGVYDSVDYDSAGGYNRGWITVWHEA